MGSNVIVFTWNRPVPGREEMSTSHFEEFQQYLGKLQQKGTIRSFDTVLLDLHSGDMNGFFLIKGDPSKLDALTASDEWVSHQVRATYHLQGAGAIRGVTGDEIRKRMEFYMHTLEEAHAHA